MPPTILVPLALREKIRRMDERIRVVSAAAAWFERDQPRATQRRIGGWLVQWERIAKETQDSVVKRWQKGELTTSQAIAALDEELKKRAPKLWSVLTR